MNPTKNDVEKAMELYHNGLSRYEAEKALEDLLHLILQEGSYPYGYTAYLTWRKQSGIAQDAHNELMPLYTEMVRLAVYGLVVRIDRPGKSLPVYRIP